MSPMATVEEESEIALAGWTRLIKRSALQDMLVASARPGILSFALGLPAAELFPAADYCEAVARVLETDSRALQYGPPFRPLKQHLVSLIALRTGWVVVPESLTPHLAVIKEASDIDTAPLSQRAISAYLDAGHLPAHLANLRQEYRRRRDAMLGALRAYFPAGARWETPTAGLFIWVELPEGIDTGELLKAAIETEQVAFIPGHAFCVGDGYRAANRMRLNFSNSSVERIEDGVRRLARALSNGHPALSGGA